MLAQHLPPASHHRSPSDPTAAAAALAANLRTIGLRDPAAAELIAHHSHAQCPPLQNRM